MLTDMQLLALVRFVEAMTRKTAASDEPNALAALYEAFGFALSEASDLPMLGDPQGEKQRWRPHMHRRGLVQRWCVVDQFDVLYEEDGQLWSGDRAQAVDKARQLNGA